MENYQTQIGWRHKRTNRLGYGCIDINETTTGSGDLHVMHNI
jgi:hypothetical protein